MRRFAFVAMPVLSGVTVLIGLYFLYVGVRTVMRGTYVAIGFGFAGFGAVGLILGFAIWSVRRQILLRIAEEASPGASAAGDSGSGRG